MLCCRSAAELRGRDPSDLGRWGAMLSLGNEVRPLCPARPHVFPPPRPACRSCAAALTVATCPLSGCCALEHM